MGDRKLFYIAINIVPQLSCSMSYLTRYLSKDMPAHLTYAKVVLRYLIGIKGRKLTCIEGRKLTRSSMAYDLFVKNATFSWRATLSHNVALSTTEAERMALASN